MRIIVKRFARDAASGTLALWDESEKDSATQLCRADMRKKKRNPVVRTIALVELQRKVGVRYELRWFHDNDA